MEFHEKLQELRKSRNLTQEELAEALYVSRTAISKWESGRGYPSIDSLKAISGFFSISIDELLSAGALVSIAENENRSNIQRICDVLFGTVDLTGILLALLPLYSRQMDNSVTAVNLWNFKPENNWISIICWLLIVAFVLPGIVKIVLNYMHIDKGKDIITISSVLISMIAVLYFSMIRETYCVVIVFLQLMIKGGLLFYAIGKVGIKERKDA